MGSVNRSGEFRTMTGQSNMFQLAMKLVIVIDAMTGAKVADLRRAAGHEIDVAFLRYHRDHFTVA